MSVFIWLYQKIASTSLPVLTLISVTACSSPPVHYSEIERSKLYITRIVYTTAVSVSYGIKTTGEGAVAGIGKVIGACLEGGTRSNDPYGMLPRILLTPVCAVFGGNHGIATSDDEKLAMGKGETIVDWVEAEKIQEEFAGYIELYPKAQGVEYELLSVRYSVTDPDDDAVASGSNGMKLSSLLQAGIREVKVERVVKGKTSELDVICIELHFKGTMQHKAGLTPIDMEMYVECNMPEKWRDYNADGLRDVISEKLQQVAENLINDYLLIYYPVIDTGSEQFKQRKARPGKNIRHTYLQV